VQWPSTSQGLAEKMSADTAALTAADGGYLVSAGAIPVVSSPPQGQWVDIATLTIPAAAPAGVYLVVGTMTYTAPRGCGAWASMVVNGTTVMSRNAAIQPASSFGGAGTIMDLSYFHIHSPGAADPIILQGGFASDALDTIAVSAFVAVYVGPYRTAMTP
jgi:hypothetical protein